MKHQIQIDTPPYDKQIFGHPWIAVVKFANDPNGEFYYGTFFAGDSHKTAGRLEIEAETGDVVAMVKKELKAPNKLPPRWYQVGFGGNLNHLSNIFEARRCFETMQCVKPSPAGPLKSKPAKTKPEQNFDFSGFPDETIITELEKRGYAISVAGPVQDTLF